MSSFLNFPSVSPMLVSYCIQDISQCWVCRHCLIIIMYYVYIIAHLSCSMGVSLITIKRLTFRLFNAYKILTNAMDENSAITVSTEKGLSDCYQLNNIWKIHVFNLYKFNILVSALFQKRKNCSHKSCETLYIELTHDHSTWP